MIDEQMEANAWRGIGKPLRNSMSIEDHKTACRYYWTSGFYAGLAIAASVAVSIATIVLVVSWII